METKYFPKKKNINPAHQRFLFLQKLPEFECSIKQDILTCKGFVQPTPLSDRYQIRIIYQLGHRPKVYIDEPKIIPRSPDEKIPHTYSEDELCLFYPKNKEWNSTMVLVDKILPWTSLWLYYYEIWLATGIWKGGGKHPTPRKKDINLN